MDTNKIFIDMAQRAHEFAEMCRIMQKIPDMPLTAEVKDALDEYAKRLGLPKADPEAWREEYRKKQAAGVRFEVISDGDNWHKGNSWKFDGNKEYYREVPQEVQKEGDMKIPEASREILKAWQAKGLKFKVIGMTARFALEFTDKTDSNYSIPEQPIPEGMSVEAVEAMWRQGLTLESYGFGWRQVSTGFNWNISCTGAELLKRLRIPAQPIPEKLLEVSQDVSASECQKALEHLARTYSADKGTAQLNPTIPPHAAELDDADEIRKWADRYYSLWCFVENSLPRDASSDTFDIFRGYARQVNDEIYGVTDKAKEPHAAERALWKAQREAGTNEVWQEFYPKGTIVTLSSNHEPDWRPDCEYRVKPMKLTANIIRRGVYKTSYCWEFTGTREEYRAECEKYGYVVISEIKEVKPKTVKYYFALVRGPLGGINSLAASSMESFNRLAENLVIIGDIEEREIEA